MSDYIQSPYETDNQPEQPEPTQKPPLGLIPRWLIDEQRKADIDAAIDRYKAAGVAIPREWISEYREILHRLLRKEMRDIRKKHKEEQRAKKH